MTKSLRALKDINRTLLAALCLAFVYHGALLLTGTYKRTYDAYVHIFFADHYARTWFDNWDYRWYTGFTVTSYPPGAQQSIALLSKQVGLLNGFVIVQLAALLMVTIGVYRFSKMWVSDEAAGYAALVVVFSSSTAETVHVFGQLPTMFSLGFILNALPFLKKWLETGKWRFLLMSLVTYAACTAGHHVTTLFGSIFFAGPVIADAIITKLRTPRDDEDLAHPLRVGRGNIRPLVFRRIRRILPVTARAGVFGFGLPCVLLFVVLPYWLWSASDPITQMPIPHASRDSYIGNINAGIVFWLVPWGLFLFALPYAVYKGATTRIWPLAAALGLATFLGTGGTTPLPKIMLGPAFEILTLDRFTFWATILVLPFVGEIVVSMRHRGLAKFLRIQFGTFVWRSVQVGLAVTFLFLSLFISNFTQFRKFQPAAIDTQPIVNFINKDQHWRWRYLTLGFGDQLAWLSSQTTATTVDGNYHSARRLPELTTTPIERLEGAKYSGVPGIGSLQQFLAVPDKYNLKYVFSNDQFYDPLLFFSGWHKVNRLENGIVVWEREDVPPLPEVLPRKEIPAYQRAMWGVVPMTAVFSAFVVLTSFVWGPLVGRLFAFIGLTRLVERLPFRRIAGFAWGIVDRRLAAWAAVPGTATTKEPRWQFWAQWWNRLPRPRPPSRRLRWLNALLLIAMLGVTTLGFLQATVRSPQTPESVVLAYYDDLDFRRFDAAYTKLDPELRPSFDEYLLGLSVKGGLLASYAKLESVRAHVVHQEESYAIVEAETLWVTSLKYYESTDTLEMVKRGDAWYFIPGEPAEIPPPDPFVRQAVVSYRAQERRQVTTGPTDFADIQDRPELQILSARLVVHDGLYSVVGEVMNTDVDPADLTVTAIVYDAESNELTKYNAQTVAMHKLLPKEVAPFRIDFEGVAGTGTGKVQPPIGFEPGQVFPVEQTIWDHAAVFQVYAKAVVTGRDLFRDVTAQDVTIASHEDGSLSVDGTLLNVGTVEAVIPHMLLTYYNELNEVVWVEEVFVDTSIRSQRMTGFSVPVAAADDVKLVLESTDLYANSLEQEITKDAVWGDRIPLPSGAPFASVRISVNYFPGGYS